MGGESAAAAAVREGMIVLDSSPVNFSTPPVVIGGRRVTERLVMWARASVAVEWRAGRGSKLGVVGVLAAAAREARQCVIKVARVFRDAARAAGGGGGI